MRLTDMEQRAVQELVEGRKQRLDLKGRTWTARSSSSPSSRFASSCSVRPTWMTKSARRSSGATPRTSQSTRLKSPVCRHSSTSCWPTAESDRIVPRAKEMAA